MQFLRAAVIIAFGKRHGRIAVARNFHQTINIFAAGNMNSDRFAHLQNRAVRNAQRQGNPPHIRCAETDLHHIAAPGGDADFIFVIAGQIDERFVGEPNRRQRTYVHARIVCDHAPVRFRIDGNDADRGRARHDQAVVIWAVPEERVRLIVRQQPCEIYGGLMLVRDVLSGGEHIHPQAGFAVVHRLHGVRYADGEQIQKLVAHLRNRVPLLALGGNIVQQRL